MLLISFLLMSQLSQVAAGCRVCGSRNCTKGLTAAALLATPVDAKLIVEQQSTPVESAIPPTHNNTDITATANDTRFDLDQLEKQHFPTNRTNSTLPLGAKKDGVPTGVVVAGGTGVGCVGCVGSIIACCKDGKCDDCNGCS